MFHRHNEKCVLWHASPHHNDSRTYLLFTPKRVSPCHGKADRLMHVTHTIRRGGRGRADVTLPFPIDHGSILWNARRTTPCLKSSSRISHGNLSALPSCEVHTSPPSTPPSVQLQAYSFFSAWFAFLLPSFATYKALARKDLDAVQNLSMYWCTIGVLVAIEYVCEWLISWWVSLSHGDIRVHLPSVNPLVLQLLTRSRRII